MLSIRTLPDKKGMYSDPDGNDMLNFEAALLEKSKSYPKPSNFKPSYGTAGFRSAAELLPSTVFRCGILMAIRCLKLQKTTGICITASHNPAPDNGVKLVDPSGEMLSQMYEAVADELANAEDETALVKLVRKILEEEKIDVGNAGKVSIIIAYDTRPSGPRLAAAAADGAACLGVPTLILGLRTTPQLHWTVMQINRGLPSSEDDYYKSLALSFSKVISSNNLGHVGDVYVDCAHGVGGQKIPKLAKLLQAAGLNLYPRNTGDGVLNADCGSDFVQKENTIPENFKDIPPDFRCCSVDGDADRLVYFTPSKCHENQIVLFDGDKIASLAAGLLKNLVAKLPGHLHDTVVGVVQTAYANGSSTTFLTNKLGCEVTVTPTGVKYLHEAAKSFDIGVYFEANGHGTILFKDTFISSLQKLQDCKAAQDLLALNNIINPAVGDAISGILLVELALKWQGWDLQQWSETYQDLPSQQLKVVVPDRTAIVTGDAERKVLQPNGLQLAIDELVSRYPSGRAFVRPSGTENVVRVYAEAANKSSAVELAQNVAYKVQEHLI